MVDFNFNIDIDTKRLDRYVGNLEDDVWDVTMVAAFHVESRAKRVVQVDTGATKNSIHVKGNRNSLEARIAAGTEYAPDLEFGGPHRRAYPFMVPSLEAERGPYIQSITQVMKRGES